MRILTLTIVVVTVASCIAMEGLNFGQLSGQGKKFFTDMTKQAMGVPSLKPENLAAQAFFRNVLDKYTRLDENIKRDMLQHVPKATKLFDAAAKKFNVNPQDAFRMLSTFFENFKQGAAGNLAQTGLQMAGKFLSGKQVQN